MPTFRQHKDKHRVDSTAYFPLGIPVVNDPEQIRELNQYLKEREVLLVLKPHPAQDLSVLNVQSLSNFVLLYDKDLRRNDIQLYEFIGNSDALITDYSSIYFDYLLTDKPIGLTISDVEEYGGTLGFAVDDIFEVLKGEYINDFSELLGFIDNVSKGIDETKEDRDIVKDLLNYYQDNKSAKRVYDFIKEKANFQS
jgi:CDP-glycerol glycerophosphotransferase (TagB/SpsB family)